MTDRFVPPLCLAILLFSLFGPLGWAEDATNPATEALLKPAVPLSIRYDWHDDGRDPKEPEHHFGVVKHDYFAGRDPVYDPKPAYLAATALTARLAGFRFERHYDTYDLDARLKKHLDFKPDIVVVAIGENVPALVSEDAKTRFEASFLRLLRALKSSGQPDIFVRSCFWPNKAKDDIMRKSCKAVGGVFVDISGLGKDASNYARSERSFAHPGVAAHPGDKGMKAIAGALLRAIRSEARDWSKGRPKWHRVNGHNPAMY